MFEFKSLQDRPHGLSYASLDGTKKTSQNHSGSQILSQKAVGKCPSSQTDEAPARYMLAARYADWMEGVMTWNSDSTWVLVYSILVTVFILAWAYVPA